MAKSCLLYTKCDFWGCPVPGQKLDSMMLVDPFQLRGSHDSVKEPPCLLYTGTRGGLLADLPTSTAWVLPLQLPFMLVELVCVSWEH